MRILIEMTVTLRPFTLEQDRIDYLNHGIQEYAQGMFEAGEYPSFEESLKVSAEEVISFYYKPKPYKLHNFYNIFELEQGHRVGRLEVVAVSRFGDLVAFINYIGIFPEFRRKGFATAALLALEPLLKAQGFLIIDLNVMAHKTEALSLYQKLDYQIKRHWMGGKAQHISRIDMRKTLA